MLPWNQFEIMTDPEDEDDMIARLDMTEEEIEALPEFKSREEIRDDEDVERTEPATTGTGTTGTTGTTGATN